ncbi:MAG: tRNA 4-thiouridine(8) synthase ThiI, partial [Clostridia bacterium]|nr:tRNA 4-thiouridine(8) synthase ThiI [Clostridia bacterium]
MSFARCILIKYGELVLKGANKRRFEKALTDDIHRAISPIGAYHTQYRQSTMALTMEDDAKTEAAFDRLSRVFGIAALSIAYPCEKRLEDILAVIREKIVPTLAPYRTYKADAKRSDKSFPLTSMELMQEAGACVGEACPHLKVDVHNPEVTVTVEVRDKLAFVHAGRVVGARGLPAGTSGDGLLLLSGGIDSPVAGWLMAKRGLRLFALHFESYPYTSERAKEKVLTLGKKLCRYTGRLDTYVIGLTELQLALRDAIREEYFTLILRRCMLRLAARLAKDKNIPALITGESLGQVASQTLSAMAASDDAAGMPILRPCVGLDKD